MKSIQDLCIWLKQLQIVLKKEVELVITPDKNFEILDTHQENVDTPVEVLFSGSDENMDINDLPYTDPKMVAKEIRDNASIRNIKVEEL